MSPRSHEPCSFLPRRKANSISTLASADERDLSSIPFTRTALLESSKPGIREINFLACLGFKLAFTSSGLEPRRRSATPVTIKSLIQCVPELAVGFADEHLQHNLQLRGCKRLGEKNHCAGGETVGRELWILFCCHHHYRDPHQPFFGFHVAHQFWT